MRVSWESVPQAASGTLRLLRLRQRQFAGPLHAHELVELTWIEAGRGLRFVGGTVEPFGPGDLVLLAPRVPHAWSTSGAQGGPVQATVLQLRLPDELLALPELRAGLGPLFQGPARAWVVDGPLRDELVARLAALPAAASLVQLGEALALLGRIGQATQWAQAGDVRPIGGVAVLPQPPGAGRPRRIDAVLAWIHRHLQAELRVDDAARLLHVTPAAFSRAFRRSVGKPFSVYVNDVRIAEACLRLTRSDRPVAEIAQHSGFATLSNFNRQFRARTGLSPRQYRARAAVPA